MSTILDEARDDYDFGEEFDYSIWSQNTALTMVNVPWNNDYRDIVRFTTQSHLDAWIDSKPNVIHDQQSYLRMGARARVAMPHNKAIKYNYLRVSNPKQPGVEDDVQRNYYYFITAVNYIAPDNTELVLQLDVWQTFGYEIGFGSCYVERGHIGIANELGFADYGRRYLSEPEGLDVGGEYRTIHVESQSVISDTGDDDYHILVCSAVDLTADPGTVDNPKLVTASGGAFQGVPSGASFYYFRGVANFKAFMVSISDKPWVSQGILSITAIPAFLRYHPGWNESANSVIVNGVTFYKAPTGQPSPKTVAMANSWRTSTWANNYVGYRYRNLKKFFTYPYMICELTTFSGSPLILKPEAWQDTNATIREMAALVPPGQRLVFSPKRYNGDIETQSSTQGAAENLEWDDFGDFLDMATTLDNFPTFPLVNDMAINFLAANKHGIAYQFRSADWSQQRAMQGASTAFGQAQSGIETEQNLTGIGTDLAQRTANVGSLFTGARAVAGGMGAVGTGALSGIAGGPVGMGIGAVQGVGQGLLGAEMAVFDIAQQQVQVRMNNDAAQRSTTARTENMGYVADTNRSMAQFAARGDYANAIAGINAKVQDAAMTQPSVTGQFGGDSFNLVNGMFGYSLRWKVLNEQALRAVGDIWLRYGYAIRQFLPMPENFMVMKKFTYWKLSETYITQAPFPEGFKQIIRGIFEKGVTVWAKPEYIGNTDWSDNDPLTGIAY